MRERGKCVGGIGIQGLKKYDSVFVYDIKQLSSGLVSCQVALQLCVMVSSMYFPLAVFCTCTC